MLVLGERTTGLGLLDPRLGGDPFLFSHLVWLYVHPALAATLIAGIGVVSHLVATSTGRAPHGRMGPLLVGLALVSVLGWGQHLYGGIVSGVAVLEVGVGAMLFQALLLIFLAQWLSSLRATSVSLGTPMFYALAFIVHFAAAYRGP